MPDARLGVEIDNRRIAPFMTLRRGAEGTIDLATIERGQKRAIAKLFVVRGETRHELGAMDVRNLPAFPNRRALLRLRCAVGSGGELRVKLDVEGRLYREERFNVRRYLSSRIPVVAVAALALLIPIGVGLYFFLFAAPRSGEPARPEPAGADAEAPSAAVTEAEAPDAAGAEAAEEAEIGAQAPPAEGATQPPDTAAPTATDPPATTEDEPKPAAEDHAEEQAPAPADTVDPPAAVEPAEWTVYFTPDSPELIPQTRSRLGEIAQRLSQLDDDEVVTIVGHTALAGTEQGRVGLSRERARNVYEYLQAQGWQPQEEVTVRGIGGRNPVTRDPEQQGLNRRVEIRVARAP